ncbi:MAG: amidohydrolase family protein, partial [Opitutaceae bacterium]
MHRHTGCTVPELFKMSALNPAKLVGVAEKMGSVAPGKLANLVALDANLGPVAVFLHGKRID